MEHDIFYSGNIQGGEYSSLSNGKRALLAKLFKQGLSDRQLAYELETTLYTVRQVCAELHLSRETEKVYIGGRWYEVPKPKFTVTGLTKEQKAKLRKQKAEQKCKDRELNKRLQDEKKAAIKEAKEQQKKAQMDALIKAANNDRRLMTEEEKKLKRHEYYVAHKAAYYDAAYKFQQTEKYQMYRKKLAEKRRNHDTATD